MVLAYLSLSNLFAIDGMMVGDSAQFLAIHSCITSILLMAAQSSIKVSGISRPFISSKPTLFDGNETDSQSDM